MKCLSNRRWFSLFSKRNKAESNLLRERIWDYLDNPENLTSVWRNFLEWNPHLFPEPTRSMLQAKLKESMEEFAEYKNNSLSELYVVDQIQIYRVMTNYHFYSHLSASIDPLNIKRPPFVEGNAKVPYRDLASQRQIPFNMKRDVILPDDSFIGGNNTILPLKDIIVRFNNSYCKHIGIEFMNNTSHESRQWIKRKFEDPAIMRTTFTPELKKITLRRLIRADCFEDFVNSKWPMEKQHSARGCEILIPALQNLIDLGSSQGAQSFVLGMTTSRTRLAVLANVFKKPLQQIFVPFRHIGTEGPELHDDDKYVLGNNVKKVTTNQALPTEFAVLASTSNFVEAIDPLVSGKTKAEQLYAADEDGKRVWPIVIHGDDVMSGQGIAFENFRNSMQENYSCKGTVHIVLTNQEKLPNQPSDIYCTNVAHTTMTPVFHVNSEDPEAVIYCMSIAAQYKMKFKTDIVVDLICYQKYFRQNIHVPTGIKEIIDKKPSVVDTYSKKLVSEGVTTWGEIQNIKDKYHNLLEYSYSKAQKSSFKISEWLDSPWKRFFDKKLQLLEPNTSIIPSIYKSTLENFLNYQADINIHPSILNTISMHLRLAKEHKISWVMAENLAIATLLQEGFNVRLTGDMSEEGQFIRRYHCYYAIDSDKTRIPLRGIYKAQGYYTVANSLSCEFANLGFEIGFSQTSPKTLVIWEGVEEDRTSLAQYMIDVFLAAGEGRWFRQTGIVCFIPNGMEGQGEGASTGRPERFLQMCNDDYREPITSMPKQLVKCNWIVANVTTPANYFHIIRRQMKLNYRKPLILFTHKELYKNTDIYSHREEFLYKKKFQVYIPDESFGPSGSSLKEDVTKVLLCTGRVYYDLLEARKNSDNLKEIAICRLEQISPFPYEMLLKDLVGYRNASFHWVQEEHRNQGWWLYVRQRLVHVMRSICAQHVDTSGRFYYIGRPTSPITATSNYNQHLKEKAIFLTEAMKLN